MASKRSRKKSSNPSGFQGLRREIRMLRGDISDGFTSLEDRLDRLMAEVTSFLRLHYALHRIEAPEKTSPFEEQLACIEAAQPN